MGEFGFLNTLGCRVYCDEEGRRAFDYENETYVQGVDENVPAHLFLQVVTDEDYDHCTTALANQIASATEYDVPNHAALLNHISSTLGFGNKNSNRYDQGEIYRIVRFAKESLSKIEISDDWLDNTLQLISFISDHQNINMIYVVNWWRNIQDDGFETYELAEEKPIIIFRFSGVITSVKSKMFKRTFDPDAVKLIGRLAEKTGAKLILSAPMVRRWPGGAEECREQLVENGCHHHLWHFEWLVPETEENTVTSVIDYWLYERDVDSLSVLLINSSANPYPGELHRNIGEYRTSELDGFTQWDYFKIIAILGVEDGDAVPPLEGPISGFEKIPAQWNGRTIEQPPKRDVRTETDACPVKPIETAKPIEQNSPTVRTYVGPSMSL